MMGDFISPLALAARLGSGSVLLVIDTRSHEAYAAGHIQGAVSIPGESLAKRLETVPRDKTVVVYCSFRRPGHSASEAAGVLLREAGRTVKVLYGGFPAWREAGQAIERADEPARRTVAGKPATLQLSLLEQDPAGGQGDEDQGDTDTQSRPSRGGRTQRERRTPGEQLRR